MDPEDLQRIWDRLCRGVDPLDPALSTWDDAAAAEVRIADLLRNGVSAATARCSNLLVSLDGVCAGDVRLPFPGIFLYRDGIGLYWWVGRGDAWNVDTVAALAEFLGELTDLAPGASRVDDERFWHAVDAYRVERSVS